MEMPIDNRGAVHWEKQIPSVHHSMGAALKSNGFDLGNLCVFRD